MGHVHLKAVMSTQQDNPQSDAPITNSVQTSIHILQMDCPTEEALLRKKLGGLAGVLGLEFNLMARVLTVTHAPQTDRPYNRTSRSIAPWNRLRTPCKPEISRPRPETSRPRDRFTMKMRRKQNPERCDGCVGRRPSQRQVKIAALLSHQLMR
jgi:hypothetical protein